MAMLFRSTRGIFRVQMSRPDGGRTSVRLGTVSRQEAKRMVRCIEELIACRKTGGSPSPATARWFVHAAPALRKHIEWLGLAAVLNPKGIPTLVEWLQAYFESRSDVKPGTQGHYRKVERHLLDFFDPNTRIDSITAGQAEDFRIWLKSMRGLADATVRRYCKRAKQFLAAAIKKRLISENPFAGIQCRDLANPTRRHFVTREEIEAVLNICPTAEFRLILALCRYGGLRCPSEVMRLRWKDIDWVRNRFTVHAPTRGGNEGGARRQVPIFPELRPYLREVFEQVREGTEYVITRCRRPDQNVGTYFRNIIRRAGLKLWPKIFQNLRNTRQTELLEKFPPHVVGAWIGNTRVLVKGDYLRVSESHYARAAAGNATVYPTLRPGPALPEGLVRGWVELPDHIKEAIITLASRASQTRPSSPAASR